MLPIWHRQLADVGRGKLTGEGGMHRQAATLLPMTSAQTSKARILAARCWAAVT
jgi:hypothetical protein